MATYVNDLRLTELATGEGSGTWGTTTNTNLELIGEALGYGTQNCFASDADATTTVADGASDPARSMYFKVTSSATLTATRVLTIAPNTVSRVMFIENATTGSQSITISQGSGANVTIATGKTAVVYLDGAGSTAAVVDAMALVDPGVTDTLAEVLTAGNATGGTDIAVGTGDDITFADSSKAIFGAGSDLQIYHTGSNSVITDVGTGSLYLGGDNNVIIASADLGTTKARFTTTDCELYFSGAEKLATTSTGIDVTGTVTADGLTVSPSGTQQILATLRANSGAGGGLLVQTDASDDGLIRGYDSSGNIQLQFDTDGGDNYIAQGNVGIGTSSPNVHGWTKALSIDGGTSNSSAVELNQNGTKVGALSLQGDQRVQVVNYTANALTFHTNGIANERMRIDSSGNVGIGTSSVSTSKLHLQGTTGTASAVRVESTAADSDAYYIADNDGSVWTWGIDGGASDAWILSNAFGLGTPKMTVTTGGNVGIGTSSPAAELHIQSASPEIRLTDSDTVTNVGKITYIDGRLVLQSDDDNQLGSSTIEFQVDGSEAMRIDSSGNVGVGITNPDGLLHLKGDTNANGAELYLQVNNNNTTDNLGAIHFGNNVDSTLSQILSGTSGANNSSYLTFSTSNAGTQSEAMRIDSSGNVGIGVVPESSWASNQTVLQLGNISADWQWGTGAGASRHITRNIYHDGTNFKYLVGSEEAEMYTQAAGNHHWYSNPNGTADATFTPSEKMRLDSNGNLLVGVTTNTTTTSAEGLVYNNGGSLLVTRDQAPAAYFTRTTSDGDITVFRKGSTTVGSIGANGGFLYAQDNAGIIKLGIPTGTHLQLIDSVGSVQPRIRASHDAGTDIGEASVRFKDLYLSGDVKFNDASSAVRNDGGELYLIASSNIRNQAAIHTFSNSAGSSEYARIDSSGNLLVGKTDTTGNVAGVDLRSTGLIVGTVSGGTVGYFNRTTSDGTILDFRKDNSAVGSIGTIGTDLYIGSGGAGVRFYESDNSIIPCSDAGVASNGSIDLGDGSFRFKDLYLSGGVDISQGTYPQNAFIDISKIISDDAVFSFTPDKSIGVLYIYGRNANYANVFGMVSYRTVTSAYCLQVLDPNSLISTSTSVLTGTTGTDGQVTISAVSSDGKIYIENREGGAISIGIHISGQ